MNEHTVQHIPRHLLIYLKASSIDVTTIRTGLSSIGQKGSTEKYHRQRMCHLKNNERDKEWEIRHACHSIHPLRI